MKTNEELKPNECEACINSGLENYTTPTGEIKQRNILTRINGLWLCESCSQQELEVIKAKHASEPMQERRVERMNILNESRKIDTSLQVRTDLFNSETIAITELKTAIDNDESIENKQYALATLVNERIKSYQKLIFDLNQQTIEAATKQRASQTYLNNLANSLRLEERNKLKIQDINYKVQPVVKPKPVIKKKPTVDRAELTKYTKILVDEGIPASEFMLQMLVISNGVSVEEAANIYRKKFKETLSEE